MTDIIKSRTDVRIPITLTIYNNMIFIHPKFRSILV